MSKQKFKRLAFIFYFLLFTNKIYTQSSKDSVTVKKKIPYYHNIVASLSVSQLKPKFLSKEFQTYSFNNYTFNFKWLEYSYGYGRVDALENGIKTQINIHDSKLGVNWTFKKLIRGNRALDVKGFLFVPSISANFTQMKVWKYNETKIRGLKIAPMVSFQFPFVGIDAKCNFDFRQNKSTHVKPFSIYPEIALKLDGLFHILDPELMYVGRYKNDRIMVTETVLSRNNDGSSTVQYDYYKVRTEFDRYSKTIGKISSFGPRYTYKNFSYAGSTQLFGIGYFLRMGALSFDAYADMGKIGFASEALNENKIEFTETLNKRNLSLETDKFNKLNVLSTGYLKSKRIGGNIGFDVLQILPTGNAGTTVEVPTGMLRFYLGAGGGYALISKPYFNSKEGELAANKLFEDRFDLAPVSENHAKFSKNTAYLSIHTALELGVIQLKLERCYYEQAYLASLNSITIGYMIPYKRIKKRLEEINK